MYLHGQATSSTDQHQAMAYHPMMMDGLTRAALEPRNLGAWPAAVPMHVATAPTTKFLPPGAFPVDVNIARSTMSSSAHSSSDPGLYEGPRLVSPSSSSSLDVASKEPARVRNRFIEDDVALDDEELLARREAAIRQAEEEGLTLMRSDNLSGYRCVFEPNKWTQAKATYRVQVKRGGTKVVLGSFATPEEAALCYARSPEGRHAAGSPACRAWMKRSSLPPMQRRRLASSRRATHETAPPHPPMMAPPNATAMNMSCGPFPVSAMPCQTPCVSAPPMLPMNVHASSTPWMQFPGVGWGQTPHPNQPFIYQPLRH